MKKRRILLALIMLVISAISLTTATYAWFSANRAVSVEQLDVKASASGGIQISADAKTWSNQVTIADLKAAGEDTVNFLPTVLKPATTIGVNKKTGAFDFYNGELDGTGQKVKVTSIADSSKQYLAFDLYFYMAQSQTIVFNEGTKIIPKDVDKGLKYSTRVGFLVQGNDPTSTQKTAQELAGGKVANQIIWEPNSDEHTQYATNQSGAHGTMAYMGGKAISSGFVTLTDGTSFETVTTSHNLVTSTVSEVYPKTTEWTFQPGITKVRVYVWLEGQDIDNEDTATLGTGLTVNLNFKIKDEPLP